MKAYMTIGMPASGKTTWAEQQIGFVNINLDDCRFEVCGDAGNHESTADAVVLHDKKIRQAASDGLDIIISDTNLNQKYRDILVQKLTDLGYQVSYILFPISLEVAKERNSKRLRVVPENVLDAMFNSFKTTKISGQLLLGDKLISNDLISELNQLANLEILFPSSEIQNLQAKLLELDLISLQGHSWVPGIQLSTWLQERGLLNLSLIPYLSSKLEDVLFEHFYIWPKEFSLSHVSGLCNKLFINPLGEAKQFSIASDLIQNKSILKTCFNENDELIDPAKLTEIIKEILK